MQRLYFSLSILILLSFLPGCAPKAVVQPAEVRALENPSPTALPEPSTTTATTISEVTAHDPPANCPITQPPDVAFLPPAPYDSLGFDGEFWYGSSSLWTAVRQNGIWEALPHSHQGYTQKVFWWREGYVWDDEPEPALIVSGERLDAASPPLMASKATNAYAGDIGSARLVGVDLPTLGCWKITGKYADAELSFVVWVAP
jgi:hypothetical protein